MQPFPNFNVLACSESQKLIIKYCRLLLGKKIRSSHIYFPYIAINSKRAFVYKISFMDNETFHISSHSVIDLPDANDDTIQFIFEKGVFKRNKCLKNYKQFKLETISNTIKIKQQENNKFEIITITLNKHLQSFVNEKPSTEDYASTDICNGIKHDICHFPIPVSGIINKNNILTLLQHDSVLSEKKHFAGYGKIGSKFNSNEYGECINNKFYLKQCSKNHIYVGTGNCVKLEEPVKTCLEFPQAILKHPSDKNKYFKCTQSFPYHQEKTCPVSYIYDVYKQKCLLINLCKTKSNTKLAIPVKLKRHFPEESFIECIGGEFHIRNCAEKFVNGKLAERGFKCCDIECCEKFDETSLIDIHVEDTQSFIRKYPGKIKICVGGLLKLSHYYQEPVLRKVREPISKNNIHKIEFDKVNFNINEAIIEYDLPTFIYFIDENKQITKKYLQTFRDAPEIFQTRKFPVTSINGKNTKDKKMYVYIEDNLNTDELVYRSESPTIFI